MSEGITHHTFKAGALNVTVKFCEVINAYFIHYGSTVKTVVSSPKLTCANELEKLVLKELISYMEFSVSLLKPELEQREKDSTTNTNIEVTP